MGCSIHSNIAVVGNDCNVFTMGDRSPVEEEGCVVYRGCFAVHIDEGFLNFTFIEQN